MKSFPKLAAILSSLFVLGTACNQNPVGNVTLRPQAGVSRYVATNGADTNAGTQAAPYLTIQKCGTVSASGDTCIIRAGTYRETVTPNSGVAFENFTGETVTVSGADLVSNWSAYSGNIFQSTVSLPISGYSDTGFFANQVFVNSEMMNEARYPNIGSDQLYRTDAIAASGTTGTTILNSGIPNLNWTGATAHIRGGFAWTSHTRTISSSAAGSVTLASSGPDCGNLCAKANNRFYLVGKLIALDAAREWFYDGTKLYLWTPTSASPSTVTVEAKKRTFAFDLAGKTGVTIKGLSIFAASINTSTTSSGVVIDGINAKYISHFVTLPENTGEPGCTIYCAHRYDSGILLRGSGHTIKNSVLKYSAGNGVMAEGSSITINNNLISDMNYAAVYAAPVLLEGNGKTVTNNTIFNSGRDGIHGGSGGNNISYNRISKFAVLNADAAGYYTCCSLDGTSTRIHHNWIYDSNYVDIGIGSAPTAGVYIDNRSKNYTIDHNVVWNTKGWGINLHGNGGESLGNKVYNNTVGKGNSSQSITLSNTSNATGTVIQNNIMREGFSLSGTAFTASNNILSSTNPNFVDAVTGNFRLQSGSPALNTGVVISGITDGFVGSAPDAGAYESGGTDWTAGCNLSGCTPAIVGISDPAGGSGQFAITNPGFENGTTGWSSYGTTAVVASDAKSGTSAMRLTGTVSGSEQVVTNLSPNTSYTLKVWAKTASAGDTVLLGVKEYGGTELTQASSSTAYTQLSITISTGASNTSAKIYCYKSVGTGNAFCDDFTFVLGSAPPPPPPATTVNNPGFESGTASWSSYGTTAVVATDAKSGTNAMRLTGTGSGSEQVVTGLSPNTSYTLKAWLKTASAGDTVLLGVKEYGGTQITQASSNTAYTELSITLTTGASNTSAKIFCYKSVGTGNAFCDDFTFVSGSTPPPPPVVVSIGNSGFESGTTSWSSYGTTAVVASDAKSGTNAMRLTGVGSGTEQLVTGLNPNTSYTLKVWIKTASAGDTVLLGVKDFGSTQITQASSSTAYTQLSVTLTTGSANTSAKIFCYKSVGTGNGFCDDFTMTKN